MVLIEQGYRLREYIYGVDVSKMVLLRVVEFPLMNYFSKICRPEKLVGYIFEGTKAR